MNPFEIIDKLNKEIRQLKLKEKRSERDVRILKQEIIRHTRESEEWKKRYLLERKKTIHEN